MSSRTAPQCPPAGSVNEERIRDYAYHLYVQSGHRNDRCGDNWREAQACLSAGIPEGESHIRLSRDLLNRDTPPLPVPKTRDDVLQRV